MFRYSLQGMVTNPPASQQAGSAALSRLSSAAVARGAYAVSSSNWKSALAGAAAVVANANCSARLGVVAPAQQEPHIVDHTHAECDAPTAVQLALMASAALEGDLRKHGQARLMLSPRLQRQPQYAT